MTILSANNKKDHKAYLLYHRPQFIEQGLKAILTWLDTKLVDGKIPETYSLAALANPSSQDVLRCWRPITRTFIGDNRRSWNIQVVPDAALEAIAETIKACVAARPTTGLLITPPALALEKMINSLGAEIGGHIAAAMPNVHKTPHVYLSWASKLFLHLRPEWPIFIWDSNTRLSINTRMLGKFNDGRHYDYKTFHGYCADDMQALLADENFRLALQKLFNERHLVLQYVCPMFSTLQPDEYDRVIKAFLTRRLYDKYLWMEAEFMGDQCGKTIRCSSLPVAPMVR